MKANLAREGKRGISTRALAAATRDEAPGPGAERTPWVGSRLAAGARSPTGAANPRGRAFEDFEGAATLRLPQLLPGLDGWKLVKVERGAFRYIRLTYRCPLCGKVIRRGSAASHALTHIEKLERAGVLRLERENGGWVVVTRDGRRLRGAGWLTLLKLAEVVNSG
jgi:hypothetical protein